MLRQYKFIVSDPEGNIVYNYVLEAHDVTFSNNMFLAAEAKNIFEMAITYETTQSLVELELLKGVYDRLNELLKNYKTLSISVEFFYPSLQSYVPIFDNGNVQEISFFTRFNDVMDEEVNSPLIRTGLVLGSTDASGSLD